MRLAAFAIMLAFALAALAASEHAATNNGLPLVSSEISPTAAPQLPPWVLRTPCGRIDRRNLTRFQERSA